MSEMVSKILKILGKGEVSHDSKGSSSFFKNFILLTISQEYFINFPTEKILTYVFPTCVVILLTITKYSFLVLYLQIHLL